MHCRVIWAHSHVNWCVLSWLLLSLFLFHITCYSCLNWIVLPFCLLKFPSDSQRVRILQSPQQKTSYYWNVLSSSWSSFYVISVLVCFWSYMRGIVCRCHSFDADLLLFVVGCCLRQFSCGERRDRMWSLLFSEGWFGLCLPDMRSNPEKHRNYIWLPMDKGIGSQRDICGFVVVEHFTVLDMFSLLITISFSLPSSPGFFLFGMS